MVAPARRIVLDGRGIISQPDGITRYTLELTREIARQSKDSHLFMLVRDDMDTHRYLRYLADLTLVPVPFSHIGSGTLTLVGRIVDRLTPNLYHSFFMLQPIRMKTPGIITVHDTLWFQRPWLQYPKNGIRRMAGWMYYRLGVGISVRKASRIITVSEATRRDLCDCWPHVWKKVRVIGEGADRRFSISLPPAKAAERLRPYSLSRENYFLHPSNGKPYKNTSMMLSAYADAAKRRNLPPLVIIGRESLFSGDIKRKVSILNQMDRLDIRFLGSVSDEDVPLLFQNARALLFPSLYEGFGLPVLEAMRAGTAVLTSRISSLPEVAGDAALLVAPGSKTEIAEAILNLAEDSQLRRRLTMSGRSQAKRFSWKRAAAAVLDLYGEVLNLEKNSK